MDNKFVKEEDGFIKGIPYDPQEAVQKIKDLKRRQSLAFAPFQKQIDELQGELDQFLAQFPEERDNVIEE